MSIKRIFLGACLLAGTQFVQAQDAKAPANWFNLDPTDDKVRGVSTEKTYNTLLKGKTSKTVIVGVIDSGIDVNHEDLKPVIWINEDEIAGNGIDDDKNGYVDDVNGWNFIGGKDGNVSHDSYELTREYARLKKKYDGKDAASISKTDKAEFDYYNQVKAAYNEKFDELKGQATGFLAFYKKYKEAKDIITPLLKGEKITLETVGKIDSKDDKVIAAKKTVEQVFAFGLTPDQMEEGFEYFNGGMEYGYNLEFNPRNIVGDDYSNLTEKVYGNKDVIGSDAKHGTHVAGIIGAARNNNIGMNGVADNVKIMVIRVVPDGDERDKDVANGIYYAVDNGAKIINMSFGKSYSPNKDIVDKAMLYAASKGVLLVHAAGNDGKNIDVEKNFPTRKPVKGKKEISNWLEIGASDWGGDEKFVADFSNYGKKTVDVFAPGVDIYATTPNQSYENLSGTSMASPVTAGVAAVLMSYFPSLTATQVREIIIKSSIKYTDRQINKPGEEDVKIAFGELSITGGMVNLYEAVKLAQTMVK